MPRPPKPKRLPPLPRRAPGTGSIQRDPLTGVLRIRLPRELNPTQTSRRVTPKPDETPEQTLARATAWLDGELGRLRRGDRASPGMTVLGWAAEWHEAYIEGVRRPNTVRNYWSAILQLGAVLTMRLDAVQPIDVQRVLARHQARLAPRTVQLIVTAWRKMFEVAVDNELLARNPCRGLSVPSASRRRTAPKAWTVEQWSALWATIDGQRFQGGLSLILDCGLRIGEVLGLHVSDINLEARRAWIGRQFTGRQFVTGRKKDDGYWISFGAVTAARLRRQIDGQPDAVLLMEHPRGPSSRSRRRGEPRPWSEDTVRNDLRALTRALGIPPLAPHSARHSLASHLTAQGVSPTVIAELLGNTAGVILASYAEPDQAEVERARRLLEERGAEGPERGIRTGT